MVEQRIDERLRSGKPDAVAEDEQAALPGPKLQHSRCPSE